MEFRNEPAINPSMPNFSLWLPIDPKERILLQRKDEGYQRWPNMWCTFGGRIEAGEKTLDTAIREKYEELGKKVGLVGKPEFFISSTWEEGEGVQKRKVNANYFAAKFNGDLSKIVLGEGAGFSVFNEETLALYNQHGLVVTPNYSAIEKFYQSLKDGTFTL